MKRFEEKMVLMKITASNSKGTNYYNQVFVEELWWVPHDYKRTKQKEIVVASFYVRNSDVKKIATGNTVLTLTSPKDGEIFTALDFENEFDIDATVRTPKGTRVVVTRKQDAIAQEKNDELEKTKKKEKKLSDTHPIVNMHSSVREQTIYDVYEKVKESVAIPMVPNMRLPIVLAGHIKEDIDITKQILEVIYDEAEHEIEEDKLELAKHFLQIYDNWCQVIVEDMIESGYLKKINVYATQAKVAPYHVIIDEEYLKHIISHYTRIGKLAFTKKKEYEPIEGYDEYMLKMAKFMSARIESIAKPLHVYGDIRESTKESLKHDFKGSFYEPQQNAIEACIKSLEKQKKTSIVGEMGVGKTRVLFSAAQIHAKNTLNKAMKLLILAPDTLIKSTWEEEINEICDNIHIHHISDIKDMKKFEKLNYLDDEKNRAFILPQKVSKDGFQYRPAANWGVVPLKNEKGYVISHDFGFSCPCCGHVIKMKKQIKDELTGEMRSVEVPVPYTYFDTNGPTVSNYKCKKCDAVLWEPINKKKNNMFVYSRYLKGFVPRDKRPIKAMIKGLMKKLETSYSVSKKEEINKQIEELGKLQLIIEGKEKEQKKRSTNRVPLGYYIFKKLKNRFTHLIIDEAHEIQGDSKRGAAALKLIHSVPYVLLGTGTTMNGYADSRYNLDFALQPEKMKQYGYQKDSRERFQVDFGVVERKYRLKREYGGKVKRNSLGLKKRPGISPVFFTLFMQGINVFLSMEDFKDELPPLEYKHIAVPMDDELKKADEELRHLLKTRTAKDKKLHKSSWALSYSFLDAPTIKKQLKNKDGEVIIETPTISIHNDNKLAELKNIVREEVHRHNNRVIIYTQYSSDNINDYYYHHLTEEGFRVTVLNPTGQKSISCDGSTTLSKGVDPADRVEFIRAEVAKGTEVLIVNPKLIETGSNLTDFNTIIWAQMGFNLYTNRQADKRIYRLSTTRPCKIIYLYYENTIQENVATLMASKIVASRSIEGHMDADGLEKLVNSRTAEEELAQIFYEGYKKGMKKARAA